MKIENARTFCPRFGNGTFYDAIRNQPQVAPSGNGNIKTHHTQGGTVANNIFATSPSKIFERFDNITLEFFRGEFIYKVMPIAVCAYFVAIIENLFDKIRVILGNGAQ